MNSSGLIGKKVVLAEIGRDRDDVRFVKLVDFIDRPTESQKRGNDGAGSVTRGFRRAFWTIRTPSQAYANARLNLRNIRCLLASRLCWFLLAGRCRCEPISFP
jgi:hypothetical protein